ncbi:MAG TPA: hypothetical protein VFC29_06630 [Candidatus Limnocylindrales bacterium]|nr:hypothetical protein [Candidatus Limnocylindrales bacterium]
MPYNVPENYRSNVPDNSGYAHHQQAEAARVKEAQEFQMQQQKAADAARKAARIAEEQHRAREMAAADQAARMRASGQRY